MSCEQPLPSAVSRRHLLEQCSQPRPSIHDVKTYSQGLLTADPMSWERLVEPRPQTLLLSSRPPAAWLTLRVEIVQTAGNSEAKRQSVALPAGKPVHALAAAQRQLPTPALSRLPRPRLPRPRLPTPASSRCLPP